MGPEEEVALKLELKNRRETAAGIHDVGDELDRTGDKAKRVGRESRVGAAGMLALGKSGRLAGRAMVYGMGAASAAVIGTGIVLTKFSKDAIGEAREAQKVGAVSRQIIKSTGGVANVSARQVGNLASAISAKAGVDDEAIQSGANLLLTFKNVRNEVGRGNKVFDRATRSAVDLSAAGFGSIESGSKMLGKALNDPVKGITALSRAGVTFTDGQKTQIGQLVEQNDLLSAQKMILKEVESQVGGVAAKQATWGEKASVSWGNIQESFGTALLPTLDRAQRWFVQEGAPALERYVGVFENQGIPKIQRFAGVIERKAIPVLGDLIDEGRPLAREILPAAGSFLETSADAFGVIAPKAQAVFQAFNDLPDWAKTTIALGAGSAIAYKKLNPGGALGTLATMAKPLPVYVVNGGVPGVPGPGKPGGPVPVGSPTVPGGKPGAPIPVPGILKGGLWNTLKLGATLTGVTLASRDGVIDDLAGKKIDTDGQQLAMLTLNKSLTETGKSLSLGADKADEFDQALRNLAYNANPAKATQHFMDYADRVGMTRSALEKAVPGFASVMRTWQQESQAAGNRTKWLTTLINGPGGLSPAIAAVARPHVGVLRIDGLDAAIEKTNTVRQYLLNMPTLGSYGNGLGVLAPPTSKPKKPKHRVRGGRLRAGEAAVVGERRAELWIPDVPGTVMPQVPSVSDIVNLMADDDAAAAPGPSVSRQLVVPVVIDGREIGRATVDDIEDRLSFL